MSENKKEEKQIPVIFTTAGWEVNENGELIEEEISQNAAIWSLEDLLRAAKKFGIIKKDDPRYDLC